MAKNLIAIDGNSLMYRAFYALPFMKRSDGMPTNAIYGFFNMLFRMIDEYQPAYLAVAFDLKAKTFRHELFEEYKAGRKKTPDDLIVQFPLIKEMLQKLQITVLEKEQFEADDILGKLKKMAEDDGNIWAYLVTGDRDAFQLISPCSSVLFTRKGVSEIEEFNVTHLQETFGLSPKQIPDLKGLMGDASDHIPGVPGVGEKTALKLLAQYPTIETLYQHLDALPQNKLKEKLEVNRELAFLSKKLATIQPNIPLECPWESIAFSGFQEENLAAVLSELEFFSLLKRKKLQKVQEIAAIEPEIISIETEAQLQDFVKNLEKQEFFAFEETEQFCSVCFEPAKEYRIFYETSFFHPEALSLDKIYQIIAPLLSSNTIGKILHGGKRCLHDWNNNFHIQGKNILFDTMLGAYVLNPTGRDFSLEKISHGYQNGKASAAVYQCYQEQKQKIEDLGLHRIYYEIELPLMNVLYSMECQGFRVNRDQLLELSKSYEAQIQNVQQQIYALSGETFNIASPKQLGQVLFEKLGLPVIKKTKTGYSTNIEVLEKLIDAHPVIPKIMEYRQLSKLKGTYIDGLIQAASNAEHKVFTTFHQTGTATGRISSSEPNLQNIPIRSNLSHEIRDVFIPMQPDHFLVTADYSQIELRVLAHIANDAHMKDAFLHDQDIHTRTASEVFGVPLEMVSQEMRSSAKAVNFGIVYGISDFGLARNLGIPIFRAKEYITRYLAEFSGVRQYMKEIVEEAKENGYVRTLWGRIRYIEELKSPNFNTRSFGERIALNTPIQGTAADIIKAAMIGVYQKLEKYHLQSKLILQVHDELIVDTAPNELELVQKILKETMENVCKLSVPLQANVSYGRTLAEAK